MNTILSRIQEISNNEGLTITAFERSIGASKGVLSRAINNGTDIQSKWLQIIVDNYPLYSAEWLLTGKGEMIAKPTKKNEEKLSNILQPTSNPNEGIPLIPIQVAAGFPITDSSGIRIEECERYIVPEFQNRGAQFLIRVTGNSMYPRYSSGDILACRKIEEIRFIQWGKVYVIDSSQDQLVKMIFEGDTPDTILCVSENSKEFPPFSLPKDDIRSLSTVIGCIKLE